LFEANIIAVTQITKELAKEWKNLSDSEKEPYEKQAKEAKEKYNQDMAEYKKKNNIEEKKPTTRKRKTAPKEEEEEDDE
jgi:mRNA-degrading endonuclease RelE of RelBE toxin-antitoxin system